ncbi:hypothetical protein ACFT39_20495 [[Kitasatospora] papulosa]|uniref:hypothetical protein n=1 Tax=Streptomyces TaxID=1883 RepID=UPI0004C9C576
MLDQFTRNGCRHIHYTRLATLREREVLMPIDDLHLPLDVYEPAPVIDVVRPEPENLALPQTTPET